MNDKNEQQTGNIETDEVKNLTSSLIKSENSLDLNSIMQLTSNLLKNETLMNSVTEYSKLRQKATSPETKAAEKTEHTSLVQQLENISNELAEIKQEIAELSSLSHRLEAISNDLSGLKKEIKDLKDQKGNAFSNLFKKS
ncbi:hypothetical protein [Bacillus sp. B15-48]|uniref:hypothetical protein n=1 Tax=Bacillus sp. B15-48 TaxID=1548601 RepID=UPI00193EC484|nr:hypothetical protein [Bacillus sp. B15-48]MBM4761166.1 hypothetical protein [Bacillus sp. B15-48]